MSAGSGSAFSVNEKLAERTEKTAAFEMRRPSLDGI